MARAIHCLIISPRFTEDSFWNCLATCELVGASYSSPPLGLTTVAAMLPREWEIQLIDRNIEELDISLWDWADLIMVGSMLPQQHDALQLIREARQRGKTVVVGGPDPSSSPNVYREASHLVLGEAELTLPRFLEDWENGSAKSEYTTTEFVELSMSPVPHFELLQLEKYLHVSIEWSRGCPFNCEFCDAIERYGRQPRAKSNEQLLAELGALYRLGYRGLVHLVDDNFIGYKKLVKHLLPEIRTWQEMHKWPFSFTAEASLNLSKDDELLKMLKGVNITSLFIGIETPEPAILDSIGKRQNTEIDIGQALKRIHAHGIYVNAGIILGFDTETNDSADNIIECAAKSGIPTVQLSLLYALPRTQLTRRLKNEGRLVERNEFAEATQERQYAIGLNFETKRPRREILEDYLRVVETLYDPSHYFERVLKVGFQLNSNSRKSHVSLGQRVKEMRGFWRLSKAMTISPRNRRHYWRVLGKVAVGNFYALWPVLKIMALYLHLEGFARDLAAQIREQIKLSETGRTSLNN
jgi:radical SAM superfamily enzyme YgiQ (UPF0313 family)